MGRLSLETLEAPAEWEAFRLPVSGFPLPEEEASALRRFWQSLSGAAVKAWKLSTGVFLQFAQLQTGDVWRRLSDHGREWKPEIGLGVWPDRPAPHLWTEKEFLDLVPGSSPVLMYQVFRVTTQAQAQARDVMLGFGTVMEVLSAEPAESFLKRGMDVFLPGIEDPMFRVYPFYVPLLEAGTLRKAKTADLEKWFCGATIYLRESVEDGAVVIASRQPLGPILRQLGGKAGSGTTAPAVWEFAT